MRRRCTIAVGLVAIAALPLQAVKFVKDVLPAVGAGTTIVVNLKTLAKGVKWTRHKVVAPVVKKVKRK